MGSAREPDLERSDRASACPSSNQVAAFVDGELSPNAARVFEAHLAACAPCRELVSAVCRADPAGDPATESSAAITLAAGESVPGERAGGDETLRPGTEIKTADGKLLYRAEVVEAGASQQTSAASVASSDSE